METKEKLGNEPAFATSELLSGSECVYQLGMSKRFLAACYAMNGIMASSECGISYKPQMVAELAYSIADEMLREENV